MQTRPHATPLRTLAGVTAVCAGLLLTAGCSDDSEGTEPLPPAETTTSSTPSSQPPATEPSTPPTTEPAWQNNYSADELAAYEEALDRFTVYEQRSEPIWRRGVATPAAEELFKQFFYTWQAETTRLETYEQANVQIIGTPTVLQSRPTRIKLTEDGQSVTIRQCIDYSTSRLLQDGVEAPGKPDSPRVRQIDLSRYVGARETPWQITIINTFEGDRRCDLD